MRGLSRSGRLCRGDKGRGVLLHQAVQRGLFRAESPDRFDLGHSDSSAYSAFGAGPRSSTGRLAVGPVIVAGPMATGGGGRPVKRQDHGFHVRWPGTFSVFALRKDCFVHATFLVDRPCSFG